MNLWDKITGNDMTREMKSFDARAQTLPADYQAAWTEMQQDFWQFGDFTGRNLMPILDGALGLLETSAADGQSIHDVLGDDIKGFCAALAGAEGAQTYRDKWRKQLNDAVAKRLEKLGG